MRLQYAGSVVATLFAFAMVIAGCGDQMYNSGFAEGESVDLPDASEDVGEAQHEDAAPDVLSEDVNPDEPEPEVCVPEVENNAAGNCCDGIDNDCDGLVDGADLGDCVVGGEDGFCTLAGGCPDSTDYTEHWCLPSTCTCQSAPWVNGPGYPGPCTAKVYEHFNDDPTIFIEYTYDLEPDPPVVSRELWTEPILQQLYPDLFPNNAFIRQVDYYYLPDGRLDFGIDFERFLHFDDDQDPAQRAFLVREHEWRLFYEPHDPPAAEPFDRFPSSRNDVITYSSVADWVYVPDRESGPEFYGYAAVVGEPDPLGGYLREGRPHEADPDQYVRETLFWVDGRIHSDEVLNAEDFSVRRSTTYTYDESDYLVRVDHFNGEPEEGWEVGHSTFENDERGHVLVEHRRHSFFDDPISKIEYDYSCW